MLSVFYIMAPFALAGHIVLWVTVWNHLNGSGASRFAVRWGSRCCFACCGLIPVVTAAAFWLGNPGSFTVATVYFSFCFTVTTVTLPWEVLRRRRAVRDNRLRRESIRRHRFPQEQRNSLRGASAVRRLILSAPGNQAFELEENERELELFRLPEALDGLKIAHISDLHFTGDIGPEWFGAAVDMVNAMQPDLVAITGDLVDNPECNSWLSSTVGRLKAEHGVFYILGNHDGRHDSEAVRRIMEQLGHHGVAGRVRHVSVQGHDLFIAGDETPWGPGMPDPSVMPSRQLISQTRILLAHSPDSIELAREGDFDLMLAGHTHGGQFCVPGYGAVVCPMQKSLELASGTIYRDPTVLHVSRGLSGELPLRLNCRPEITNLILRCSTRADSRSDGNPVISQERDASRQDCVRA